ncbi:hypothetical protein AO738_00475 [Pseudomonas citronellolis]|nr:hypothetical protein AO742_22395 [Pseudomonas citronellolis]KRW76729.1 hypothetical protein AO738_00475 [Pseudomonas citronellolis]
MFLLSSWHAANPFAVGDGRRKGPKRLSAGLGKTVVPPVRFFGVADALGLETQDRRFEARSEARLAPRPNGV